MDPELASRHGKIDFKECSQVNRYGQLLDDDLAAVSLSQATKNEITDSWQCNKCILVDIGVFLSLENNDEEDTSRNKTTLPRPS